MDYYAISVNSTNRDNNEDSYISINKNDFYIFGVADGIGGYQFGEIASKLAIEQLQKFNPEIPPETFFHQADKEIKNECKKRNAIMGTTLAACIINQKTGETFIGHVGDSRVYLFNNSIWRTKDHTLVRELVDMGIIQASDEINHPEKHRLNKALGTCESISVETYNTKNDYTMILLSTDGLHDFIDDNTIFDIIKNKSLKNATEELIKQARTNGSSDDITIILIRKE